MKMKVLVTRLYRSLCDLMDCSLPGCSIHGNSPGKNTGVYHTHTHTHTHPPLIIREQKFLQTERGATLQTRAQSALTLILKLVIRVLISILLIILGTVNLQFQGGFVPISVRPVLEIVSAYVVATVWSLTPPTWWRFKYL